jgi:hypothetical protein
MKNLFFLHLLVVLLAVVCLWKMRHELLERPVGPGGWAVPSILAILVAAALLIVSPGKRFELWIIAIVLGLAAGTGMGMILKATKDYERNLVKVQRTIDGFGAAALLLLLAIARLVTSDLMTRQSGKFGVLGASASFLAAYLFARAVAIWFYTAPRTIHLDMTDDGRRKAG